MYLTIDTPATVYTARLAAVPSSTDSVVSITYNTGSGTHTDILADQTMLIGTSAGADDLGQVRIRNLTGIGAVSGTFNIAEESHVNWSSGAYLTVLDEFPPRPRHPRSVGTTQYMDYDVAYSDQNSHCDSVPVLGPAYVAWLTGSTVSITPDASQSWALNNTITGYAWTATGASATSGTTTATPTLTYNATGRYRISCAITNSDGKTFTGYRYVYIVSEAEPPITTFQIESLSGDYSSGGWVARIRMQENADRTTIRDRAMIVLHTRDWYGSTEGLIGYVAGCENILFVGWIVGESIEWLPEDEPSEVVFEAVTLNGILDKMTAFPEGIRDINAAPSKWFKFQGLTTKAACWHLLHWQTTATRGCDVFYCDNSLRAAKISAPGEQTIWQQLNTMLDQGIIGKACCDRYSRLFLQREQNLTETTPRAAIPSVMTLTGSDWTGTISFDRRIMDDVSLVDLSGVSFDGTNANPYASLAPGHVFGIFGSPFTRDKLILETQAKTNTLAGLAYGWQNNPYPRLRVEFASHQRLIDLAPYQWVTIPVTAADTPRSFAATIRAIPRSITYTFEDGVILASAEFEAESFEALSITDVRPPLSVPPTYPPPPPIPVVPPVPIITADGAGVWISHENPAATPARAVIVSTDFFSNPGNPTWAAVSSLPADCAAITYHQTSVKGDYLYLVGTDTGGHGAIWLASTPTGTPSWTKKIAYNDLISDTTDPDGVHYQFYYTGAAIGVDKSNNYPHFKIVAASVPMTSAFLVSFNGATMTISGGAGRYKIGTHYVDRNPYGLWEEPHTIIGNFTVGVLSGWSYLPDVQNGYHATPTGFQVGSMCATNSLYDVISSFYLKKLQAFGNTWTTVATCRNDNGSGYLSSPTAQGNSIYVLQTVDGSGPFQVVYSEDGMAFRQGVTRAVGGAAILRSGKLQGGRYVVASMGNDALGTVINSNVPVRHCADLADETTYPWTDDTGNMWSGGGAVITAGNLIIKNMTVTY